MFDTFNCENGCREVPLGRRVIIDELPWCADTCALCNWCSGPAVTLVDGYLACKPCAGSKERREALEEAQCLA